MKNKIHDIFNKDIREYNVVVMFILALFFISLIGFISYKISNSYAIFTDEVNGIKRIIIHYEEASAETILYTDGTLIINERAVNRDSNIQSHGEIVKEFSPMKTEGSDVEKYIFDNESQQPWNNDRDFITKVEIDQNIKPTSTAFWFSGLISMAEGNFDNLDTSKVTDMSNMFYHAGYNATSWNIGDLSNWDTSHVTNMSEMFDGAGYSASTWTSIGTLKIYAPNIYGIFKNCPKAKALLNVYSNPESGMTGFTEAFASSATASDALITVNYSSITNNIDNIIATKGNDSNVVKGIQLD